MFAFLGHKWGEPVLGTPSGQINWNADLSGLTPASGSTVADLEASLQDAFMAWEDVAALSFNQTVGSGVSIFDTSFGGGSATLASATISDLSDFSEPRIAFIQFSSDEIWSPGTDADPSTENFFAVALHEIGHIIGLEHVDDPTQIMNAFLVAEDLGNGDIAGIQALYGTDGSDVPVDIDEDALATAVDDATGSRSGGGDDGGGGGGGVIALLLGLVGLALSTFTGGAGGLAVLAASRMVDDDEEETTLESGHDHAFDDADHFDEGFLPGIPVEHRLYSQPFADEDDHEDDEVFLL